MRAIALEFNELSPTLTEKFMAAGKLPNFKRLHAESQVAVTEADAPAPDLEPWIQWVTVHSGLSYAEHQIHHLGDGHKLEADNVWDVLSDNGKSVWVCGSMNINYRTPINGWVLPDPWVLRVPPYPDYELLPYYKFVSANVQEHTREDSALSRGDQVDFLKFMLRHGLSLSTITSIVKQLGGEKRGDVKWKRPVILDRIQYDLFRWHWKRAKPDFSTLFLNSTAHYQHLYWRNMEPEHFKIKPEPGEQAVYQEAILFGYEQMDRLLGELMAMVGDDTTLILLTALSQQPSVKYEDIGGKVLYRPNDFQKFLGQIGIDQPAEVTPVMAEEFNLDFADEEAAKAVQAKFEQINVNGEQLMRSKREGRELKTGCQVWRQLDEDAVITLADGSTVPFFDCFYQLNLMKSGQHHPDGMMWIRSPQVRPQVLAEKVPLVAVAPTILELYGVEAPSGLSGRPVLQAV
ncbi:MAG: hypothetical protein JST08_19155 [Actinobacteria bacterium]|nr:hypothetical protein [Actinomycetota bacterium]